MFFGRWKMKPVNRNHRRKGSDCEITRETSSSQTTENTSQKNHNTRKRNKNKLYSIAHSDLLGRYLTANKNITAGEIIIEKDEPLVIGPVQQSQLLCLGCYVIINNVNDYRCTKCNWPMCSSSCSGLYKRTGHDVGECKILAEISFDGEMQRDVINVYNFIVPLRCLLLKRSSQSKWNTLLSMESHNNIRRSIKNIWNLNTKTVVEKLQKYFDPDEIHTVCGILEVNCFEVTKDELSLRALFPLAFLLSHNCVPNTIHTNDEHFQLKVRASVDIPKGEPITISYAYTLHGTVKRRAHIKETKFFDCTCDRCADPTELGTNNSTITCPKCNHASLVSCSPLIEDTRWICKYRKCSGFSVSDSYVQDLIEKLESELKLISDDDVETFEIWLKRAASNLHENHYLILGVKYTLSLLYGKTQGYMIHEMNEDLLRRKVTICEDILKVADIIEPGLSRLRGIILYELHAPLMMLTTQKFKSQNVSKKQLKHSLQKIIQYLKEACTIMEFESEATTEGQIAQAARQALDATYEWEKTLGKLT